MTSPVTTPGPTPGTSRLPGPPRWRARLLTVAVTLACVVLAAVGIRASEAPDNYQIVRGVVGRTVAINEGTVLVRGMEVGGSLFRDGDVTATTPGMFVSVGVTGSAPGRDTLVLGRIELSSGDRVYSPFSSLAGLNVPPGFSTSEDFVFEVDPNRIDNLTVDLWQGEIVVGYHQRIRIPLGVTARSAADLRAIDTRPIVEPDIYGTTSPIP